MSTFSSRQLVLIAGLALATGARAAEPTTSDAPDIVVVTATRQDTRLLDLAGNTSVIDSGQIAFTEAQRPSELLNQLPGVDIQQGSGAEHITAIRSPALNGGAGQGSFLYLEDGVPLRAAGFGNVNGLYEENIEQAGSVEVVRGPGSALYGSNAVHGLVNVIPLAPARQFEAEASLLWGMFGKWQEMGTISDAADSNRYRLSVEDNHESGWRQDTRLDEQKFIARDVWTGPTDTVTASVSGQDLNQQTGAYLVGADAYLNRTLDKTNPVPNAYRKADSVRGMVRWEHDFSESVRLIVTPYARYTEMNFLMSYLPSLAIQKNAHESGGVQSALYLSLAGGHTIIVGTDLEYTNGWYTEVQTLPTFALGSSVYPNGLHYDLGVAAAVAAPYVHSEWQIATHTRLTAGVRLEETADDYSNRASSGIFGLFQRPPSRNDHFTTVTPKLGMVEQWQDNLSSYLNLARGARAPQVSDLYELQNRQVVGQVKAETMDSAEIGTRGRAGGVTFDATAYWMAKDHYFYRAADGLNVPDGKTLHRGVELALSAPLPAHFDVAVAASDALHSYAFNFSDSTAISTVRKGTVMPEAPRTLANLRLGYAFFADARAELEWVHMGGYFLDNADTHRYGGHELLNLRIAGKLGERLSLETKIMNLTNRAYADRAAITTTGVNEYFPGAPLTVIGSARLRF